VKISRILGTGSGIPAKVMTNSDLEKLVDTSDSWIAERTGIRQRRVLPEGQVTSDLAAEAARNACTAAGVSPREIDCIVLGTVTPDMPMPATATIVAHKLGCAPGTAAFDISAACAGFIYGLSIADAFIKAGQFKRVLVIGVEILTRVLDWTDRNTCVLFGDGAGAVVLGPEPEAQRRGLLSTHIYSDGSGAEHLNIPGGGSLHPTTADTVAQKLHMVKMSGRAIFTSAVRNISAACQAAIDHNHMTAGDVDLVVPHQANLRIIEAISQRCALPLDRFYLNIHKYGNTSSASIPIALDEAVREGRVKEGMSLLLCALGAGLSWGSAMVRW
jgi:3-oxoacyl-[acyl-carrier-protein] synthase III